jgi:carboxyl-terminal processing protease
VGYAPIAIAAAGVLFLVAPARAQPADLPPEQWKSLSKAVRIIRRDYVDPVDDQRLAQGCAQRVSAMPGVRKDAHLAVGALTDVPPMLRAAATGAVVPKDLVAECLGGMLESLDAGSSFVTPPGGRETGGGFAATGLELTRREQAIVVVDVYEGSPAASAGIRAGDRLAAIAGRSVDGVPLAEVTRRLRGTVGSTVSLTIARGAEVLELTLTRAIVKPITVKAHVVAPAILHLKIRRFEESTLGEADAAIAPLIDKLETTPRALLLDLRDDTGGLFRSAIDLATGFLPAGASVGSLEGRRTDKDQKIVGQRTWARESVREWLQKVPATVLVNDGTASGAEIVAAALQAHGRALVLGTPTAGAGSIQTLFPVDNGAFLRLTTARWLTPKAERLDRRPVAPDIALVIALRPGPPSARDAMLEDALDYLKTRRTPR